MLLHGFILPFEHSTLLLYQNFREKAISWILIFHEIKGYTGGIQHFQRSFQQFTGERCGKPGKTMGETGFFCGKAFNWRFFPFNKQLNLLYRAPAWGGQKKKGGVSTLLSKSLFKISKYAERARIFLPCKAKNRRQYFVYCKIF
ncbi:MAG: hypothetical protein HFF11_03085 [Angelakisella sp.]|nr:hypothetical protein [Angelakisella sp.]